MSRAGARTGLQLQGHGDMQGLNSSSLAIFSDSNGDFAIARLVTCFFLLFEKGHIQAIVAESGPAISALCSSSSVFLPRIMTPAGLEPAIPGSVGRCLIHWATGPVGNDELQFVS